MQLNGVWLFAVTDSLLLLAGQSRRTGPTLDILGEVRALHFNHVHLGGLRWQRLRDLRGQYTQGTQGAVHPGGSGGSTLRGLRGQRLRGLRGSTLNGLRGQYT